MYEQIYEYCVRNTVSPNFSVTNKVQLNAAELQYGCFELVLESLGKTPIAADIIMYGIIRMIFFFIFLMVCCVYSLELPQ